MSVQWANLEGVKSTIRDVRNDQTPTDWALITYEGPKSQTLVIAGSGSGGISELVQHLKPDMVGYGLVRKTDRIDDSETVKFAFILYLGDKVGIMQKARISVHSASVKEVVGQFHIDIAATSTDELTEDILVRKIQDTSGSGTRVLDEGGNRQANKTSTSRNAAARVNTSATGLNLPDRSDLQDIRQGTADWTLFSYDESGTGIVLVGKGTGGVNELVQNLSDEIVGYGLVRVIERVDESDTVKFAYINWTGDNIPRMLRARIGTHSGAIKEFLSPYHVDVAATQKSEVTEEIVVKTIKKAAGTADHVLDKAVGSMSISEKPRQTASHPTGSLARTAPAVAKTSQGISIGNEEELRAAIADVRSDATETNWVLATYDGPNSNTINLLAKGSGGVDELTTHLRDDIVAYGLVRGVEEYDLSHNVRFVFISWIGDNINRMLRGRLGTHSGAVKDVFGNYHTDHHASNLSEINAEIITDKIRAAMGTKKLVKD